MTINFRALFRDLSSPLERKEMFHRIMQELTGDPRSLALLMDGYRTVEYEHRLAAEREDAKREIEMAIEKGRAMQRDDQLNPPAIDKWPGVAAFCSHVDEYILR